MSEERGFFQGLKKPNWKKVKKGLKKGFKGLKKPFKGFFPDRKHPNEDDEDLGSLEPQRIHVEEGIPGTSAMESIVSFTVEGDKELPLGGAAEKEKDEEEKSDKCSVNSWDLDSDTCSKEDKCTPWPSSDRVPEPRRALANLEGSSQGSDLVDLNALPIPEDLHCLCKNFSNVRGREWICMADAIACKNLPGMLEHFMASPESVCEHLMFEVLASPYCNLNTCLTYFLHKLNEGSWLRADTKEQVLAKVRAIKGLGTIVAFYADNKLLESWLPHLFTSLGNIIIGQVHKPETEETDVFIEREDAVDILANVYLKLGLVDRMDAKLGCSHSGTPGYQWRSAEPQKIHGEEGIPGTFAAESIFSFTDQGGKEVLLVAAAEKEEDEEEMPDQCSVNSGDIESHTCAKKAESTPGLNLDSSAEPRSFHVEEGIPGPSAGEIIVSFTDEGDKEVPLGAVAEKEEDKEEMPDKCSMNSWDLDSDSCPEEAEWTPSPSSDSSPEIQRIPVEEGIPETSAAESIVSFTDEEDEEVPLEASAQKEKDEEEMPDKCSLNSWDLDSDTSPEEVECKPGPSSGRRTAADLEGSSQGSDLVDLNALPTPEVLHGLCQNFSSFAGKERRHVGDAIACKHLPLMLEHFMASPEKICEDLMYKVLASPNLNLDTCLTHFLCKLNEGSWLIPDSQGRVLAKVNAIKGINIIVWHLADVNRLRSWLPFFFATLANVMVGESHRSKIKATTRNSSISIDQEKVVDILGTLLLRLDLISEMRDTLEPCLA